MKLPALLIENFYDYPPPAPPKRGDYKIIDKLQKGLIYSQRL